MHMKVKINKVKSNPRNPRLIKNHKYVKLVKSITEFPEMLEKRPLICETVENNYVVLGGNMRLKACIEVGLKEVPILLADDWTEEQKKEFVIKDNVSFGEWEYDDLANEYEASLLNSWGVDVWDMTENTIADIEEVTDFSESVNFIIKCENIEELEKLKVKLNTEANKLDCNKLLQILDL
jgi:ParB-like chromosome segregation protein Spo0J